MADLLNGLPAAVGALESGKVVKCTSTYYIRKRHSYLGTSDIMEFYTDKTGAWSTFGYGSFDLSGDYEISTDPLAPPAEPEPLAIESKTKEITE